MTQIIPAVLARTEQEYREKLQKIETCPELAEGWIHVDFIDGLFVPGKTITPEIFKKYPTKLKIEAHLMVENPSEYMSGVEVDRVIAHVETQGWGGMRGLAINPETEISAVKPFLANIDSVLIMGVYPGKQGQEFIPEVLVKIKGLVTLRLRPGYDFTIGVDGGITVENAKLIVDAGADYLVVGSHLIEGELGENLEKFYQALQDRKS